MKAIGLALLFGMLPAITFAAEPTISVESIDGTVTRGVDGTTQKIKITRTGDTSASSTVTYTAIGTGDNPATASDFNPSGLPTGSVTFLGDTPVTWKVSGLEEPPAMTQNALIVEDVCPEDDRWPTYEEGAGRDIKVILPKDRVCQPNRTALSCDGGGRLMSYIGGTDGNPARNIWIVGGKIENKWGQGDKVCSNGKREDVGHGAISAQWFTGTLFIEGVHVDLKCTCEDVVRINGHRKDARVVLQNMRAEGFAQCSPGTHGDLIHPQSSLYGTLKEIKLENVVALRDNQVVWAPPRPTTGHGVREKLTLDHVIIKKRDCDEASGDGWVLGWKEPNSELAPTNDVRFRNTWIQSLNTGYGTTPRWSSLDSNNCAVYSSNANVKEGAWCIKDEDPELYAPLSLIGLNYVRSNFTNPQ